MCERIWTLPGLLSFGHPVAGGVDAGGMRPWLEPPQAPSQSLIQAACGCQKAGVNATGYSCAAPFGDAPDADAGAIFLFAMNNRRWQNRSD